jgi:prepilin-type N-terminal cleavage/methylation domain-containing protein
MVHAMRSEIHSNRINRKGFTLMEVVIAIGVITMALVAIMPAIGVGSRTVSVSTDRARALELLENIHVDVQTSLAMKRERSLIYEIDLRSAGAREIFFNNDEETVSNAKNARYRVRMVYRVAQPKALEPAHWHLSARWPAAAPAGKEAASVEWTGGGEL